MQVKVVAFLTIFAFGMFSANFAFATGGNCQNSAESSGHKPPLEPGFWKQFWRLFGPKPKTPPRPRFSIRVGNLEFSGDPNQTTRPNDANAQSSQENVERLQLYVRQRDEFIRRQNVRLERMPPERKAANTQSRIQVLEEARNQIGDPAQRMTIDENIQAMRKGIQVGGLTPAESAYYFDSYFTELVPLQQKLAQANLYIEAADTALREMGSTVEAEDARQEIVTELSRVKSEAEIFTLLLNDVSARIVNLNRLDPTFFQDMIRLGH